ncbi:unnamed protein product [Lepeophtheirus salmonis]|uniref:(salmon louse) hypothetical protein n=1 Tax=Lepeophtheirus salmonis TaxID=72036 RepID=A0A817FDP6_LEPSM|nr:unnamed protein product [Lepeophtheirus salmonis]
MTNRIKGFGNIETCHRVGPFSLSGFPKDTIEGRVSLSPSIKPQIDKLIITKRINFQERAASPGPYAGPLEVMLLRDSPSSLFVDGSVFKEDNSNSVNHIHSSSGMLVPLIAVIWGRLESAALKRAWLAEASCLAMYSLLILGKDVKEYVTFEGLEISR